MRRRDEIKFIMGSKDPTLMPLKSVWMETMQLATRAAALFDGSSPKMENSMNTLGTLVNGLKSAIEKTQSLSKGAGKALERSFIVIFELAGAEYCFEVNTVQEVVEPKRLLILPEMPFFMKGVMEHRQNVIPIIDPAEIMNVPAKHDKRRLILVKRNGDSIGLFVDNVKQIEPVVSGYFRQPRDDQPLLKMVYEDGTRIIQMLDPILVLDAGLRKAFAYSRRVNGAKSNRFHGSLRSESSESSAPFRQPRPSPPIRGDLAAA